MRVLALVGEGFERGGALAELGLAAGWWLLREALIYSRPFGLSLSKPLIFRGMPFDKLRANGFIQRFLRRLYCGMPFAGVSLIDGGCFLLAGKWRRCQWV